jgi:predicted RND superfamily exporter protein
MRYGHETSMKSHREGHARFAEMIVKRRRAVVVITLLLAAVAAVGAMRVRLNADFVTYLNAGNPLVRAYRYVSAGTRWAWCW